MNSEFKFFRRSNMTANQTATENGSCHQNGMQQRVIPSKFALRLEISKLISTISKPISVVRLDLPVTGIPGRITERRAGRGDN